MRHSPRSHKGSPLKGPQAGGSPLSPAGRGAGQRLVPTSSFVNSPLGLLGLALLCFGTYPLFLRGPEEAHALLRKQSKQPCPRACNCSVAVDADTDAAAQGVQSLIGADSEEGLGGGGGGPGEKSGPDERPRGGVDEGGGGLGAQGDPAMPSSRGEGSSRGEEGEPAAVAESAAAAAAARPRPSSPLAATPAKQGRRRGSRPHRPPAKIRAAWRASGLPPAWLGGAQTPAAALAGLQPDEPPDQQASGGPPDQQVAEDRHVDGEEDGDAADEGADAEEAEGAEKQPEPEGPPCRCEGGAAQDCDEERVHHRAVSSVCAIAPDIRGVYHYHKWRLSRRLNHTEVLDRIQEITLRSGNKMQAEVGNKMLESRTFRAKVMRKMRDSYGRRFQLPAPLDVFNEALQDQEEFEDRDQEDAYLSVLAATVLSAVRDSMHDQEFMHADHMFYSLENHERLREGHDPIRNETLPFLPPESPRLRYGTCAVVGNSGNLLEDHYGPDIDAHDAVIRTNQAPAWKYEDFVGSRTDVRVLNKRWTDELGRRHIDLLKNDASGMVAISSRENVRQFTLFARALQKALPQATPLFLSTRVVTGAMRFLRLFRKGITAGLPRTIRGGNTASSGILALFLAIQFCEKVDVYGFSMEECRTDGCSRGYHYFRGIADSPFLRAHPSHSFEMEGLVLRAMHALGVACLYPSPVITGECGSRLGGLIGDAGKWSRGSGTQAPRDLWDAMAWLKLSNVTSLRHRIEEYKALHAAAIAAAAAERAQDQEVEGQAEHRGGEAMIADEHDADGIVSRMEQV